MKTIMAAGGLVLALALPGATALAAAGDPGSTVTGTIVGGSALLDASRAAQLGRWLGIGSIQLSNVYTLKAGDTSASFHAAADGKGPTFTLLEVTNPAGNSYLVGGYDPQSWAANEGWHETARDWQRTAFLFNMTVPAVYRQILTGAQLPSQGQRQTFNDVSLGPVFGSGPDLYVNDRLDGALSWQLSYGNPADEALSIIDRSARGENVRLVAMEIFAVTPVPEPGRAAMLLAGVGMLVAGARRRVRERDRHGRIKRLLDTAVYALDLAGPQIYAFGSDAAEQPQAAAQRAARSFSLRVGRLIARSIASDMRCIA